MRLAIRSRGPKLEKAERDAIQRRLRFLLARYCTRVGRVEVALTHHEDQRSREQTQCRIVAHLVPAGQVCVEVMEVDPGTAVDQAAARIGPAVNRELKGRRDRRNIPVP
jgi:ribosome-associated translation inhibitor RaiA